MASHAQVFLLLMVSQLLLSVTAVSAPLLKEDTLKEIKRVGEFLVRHLDEIRQASIPILDLIEKDKIASAILNAAFLIITGSTRDDPVLKKVIDEFQNLNIKLDKYHVKQSWDSWASGAYSKPEMDIEVAWSDFFVLLRSLSESEDKEAEKRYLEEFLTSYQKYEPATKMLHKLLTAKEPTFISNLGLMLADYVNCHRTDIKQYSAFIYSLIFRGNLLNEFYYDFKNISSQARIERLTDIQYDTAAAMFQVQKHCISQISVYVESDVTDLIDKNKDRKTLAKEIREHLEKSFEKKYEWIVVAFKTKRSQMSFFGKYRNKHTLYGFSMASKEGISVGVARQTHGTYNMAENVKQAIKKCLTQMFWCSEVEGKLRECKETVNNVPMLETYTAVHAFHGNSHESSSSDTSDTISLYDNVEYDLSFNSNPNIYEGECKIVTLLSKKLFRGKFHVMIKNDEEITKNVCINLKCGNEVQGKCEAVGSPAIALCVCNKPYYGKNCEKKLTHYKKANN